MKYSGIVFLLLIVTSLIWLGSRTSIEEGPVSIRYAGITNYKDRGYAQFAIANHTDKDLRGYTFTIMQSPDGWIAPRAYASSMTYKDQRTIWLAATQRPPNNISMVAVLPPSNAVWRIVLKAPGVGASKPGWRVKTANWLIQRRQFRIGQWFMPRSTKSETLPDDIARQCALGPQMRGAKPR